MYRLLPLDKYIIKCIKNYKISFLYQKNIIKLPSYTLYIVTHLQWFTITLTLN